MSLIKGSTIAAAGAGLLVLLAGIRGMRKSPEPRTAGAPASAPASAPDVRSAPAETAQTVVKRWPKRTRDAAELMLEKYGEPDQFDRDTLAWFNNGDWKKTVVRRAPSRRDPAGKAGDFIEQTVGFLVPGEKVADLNRFNPMIDVSLTAGEMTVASDSESRNRLALNLAEEIVTGKRGVADARAFYERTARLSASGKSSSYLDKLHFEADNQRFMTPTGADR